MPVHLEQSVGEDWEKKSEWEQKARSWREEFGLSFKIGILGGFLSSKGGILFDLSLTSSLWLLSRGWIVHGTRMEAEKPGRKLLE